MSPARFGLALALAGSVLGPRTLVCQAAATSRRRRCSHLVGEQPTITYIHFWGVGPLDAVLRGLRAALDVAK